MLRKDYIQRKFEEFGKFLALLMGFKQNNQWAELERQINENSQKFSGVEIGAIEMISDPVLLIELTQVRDLKEEQLKVLGDLLYEKGLAYTNLQKPFEAKNAFIKAKAIYLHIQTNSLEVDFSLDMHFKLKAIEQLLKA
jgi:hypothetical protein